jgi:hypothetical protein
MDSRDFMAIDAKLDQILENLKNADTRDTALLSAIETLGTALASPTPPALSKGLKWLLALFLIVASAAGIVFMLSQVL